VPSSKPLLEGLAFEQLHRDERRLRADIVDGADIWMVQRGRSPGLPLETLESRRRRRRGAVGQNLDCHHTVETRVQCPIHFAHPAGTQVADDFVGAEASAGG
jgi:hypothetical protein